MTLIVAGLMLASCSSSVNSYRLAAGGQYALQAMTLSDEQVRSYVSQYIAKLDAQSTVLPESSPYTKRLRKLTAGLNSVDGVPLNFKVYQDNDANAFACADGSVRVYTKLMDLMTDDQVLGVIGHEIGHVALKHTKKQLRNSLLTSAALQGVAAQSTTAAILTDSQLGALGKTILNAQYSKKQETEADEYGYKFLKSCGKNPLAMADAFKKLKELGGSSSSSVTSAVSRLLSTHPDLDKRIANIQKMAAADGYKVK